MTGTLATTLRLRVLDRALQKRVRMKRSNHVRQTILGWLLGLGLVLVIAFALIEFAMGTREFTGGEWDPSITETTISDTEHDNDPPMTGQGLEAKP